MDSKKHISLLAALAAMAVALLAARANGQGLDPCANVIEKQLCIALVRGTKSWPEAMTNALEAFIRKADEAKKLSGEIPNNLQSSLKPQRKDFTKACEGGYEAAAEIAKKCLGYVKNGDPQSSLKNALLDSLAQELHVCFEAFQEIAMPPQLAKADAELEVYVTILSTIADAKS